MSRCLEFYEKWAKDPNWCEKSPEAVRLINNYMKLMDILECRGVSRETTNVGVTEGACRPLFTEKDPNIKEKAILSIKNSLETGKNPITGKFKKKITAGDVKKIIRNLKREAMQKQPITPKGKYRVIYADPPWQYGSSGLDEYGPAERHYPTLSIGELCEMGEDTEPFVKKITEENAVLFIWVTSPLLEDVFPVINAWGFKYKTSFVWDKVKHNFGNYNSVRHELLLVCTKGSCTPDSDKKVDSVQVIERTAKHSEKPEEFRNIINSLYTHGRRIELFSRRKADGWEAWGNDTLDTKQPS